MSTSSAGMRATTPLDQPADAPATGPDRAGQALRLLTVLPALLATAWLLAALPLILLGKFTPWLMLAVATPLAVVIVVFGVRSGPVRGLAARAAGTRTPWWTVVTLVVIAAGFALDQYHYRAQEIIPQRDPSAYAQFGVWLARHGSLPISQQNAAFGGFSRLLSFDTPGFYQVGHTIVPQFMAGTPSAVAAGFWIGGIHMATGINALLGACGVLAFGGLLARLVGPRWAPVGALTLALSLPEEFVSRSLYSEPLAQVLFLGGLSLLLDSLGSDRGAARQKIVACLAGLALGFTLLVRIDGLSDILPLIPYCGFLVLQRRGQVWPLLAGAVVGGAYGVVDGFVLTKPYLETNKGPLEELAAAGAVVLVITAVAVVILWRRGMPSLGNRWLGGAAAVIPAIILLAFAVRPYVQTTTAARTSLQARAMAGFQRADHLPVRPDQMYLEQTFHWVEWYIGIPVLVLAAIGAGILARRCLSGREPAWALPLMVFGWTIVTVLAMPNITPDQPWGSRRLVPAVLPGFILLGAWAAQWLLAKLRERGSRRSFVAVPAVILAAALILPAAQGSFRFSLQRGGPLGVRVTSQGLAMKFTFGGEIGAVNATCAAIPGNASVLLVSTGTADEMAQVIRGECGVPSAVVLQPTVANVDLLAGKIRAAGRVPVAVGSGATGLSMYGGTVTKAVVLRTRGNEHTLVTPPYGSTGDRIPVFVSVVPPGPAA